MFEDEYDEIETVKRKQRKIDKHFPILLNGVKTKIVNFLFKNVDEEFVKGKTIELISKVKIPYAADDINLIEIERGGKKYKINGRWQNAFMSKGNYTFTFLIVSEKIEE